jgi:ubiquinol-cytochrome c reductase cytochrome b subunit
MRDWLDSRTGFRSLLKHLLDEPLPSGVGWWFVTGSIVLFLLTVQLLTGVLLAIFYSPSPDHAYDSVRFIMERVTFGRVLRGLHFFGASFIVVAAIVHMLRVVAFGSYKKPRELNWMIGVLLLLIILGFALTGYLLPWDQKAYWATTVTLNIARSVPFAGDAVSNLLKGGTDLGALTLMRWYAAHVFLLPACLIVFTIAHVYLMRRHGISGPIKEVPGPATPFYPYHAIKDTIAVAAVFALLLTFAVAFNAPLDAVADPTDATYIPRPEWYFMSLFELLKHFPGRWEPVATMVIPGLVVALLFLLPFLDRRPDRAPTKRPVVISSFAIILTSIALLTYEGFRTTPSPAAQTVQAAARQSVVGASVSARLSWSRTSSRTCRRSRASPSTSSWGRWASWRRRWASAATTVTRERDGQGRVGVRRESKEIDRPADGVDGAGDQSRQLLRPTRGDVLDVPSPPPDASPDTAFSTGSTARRIGARRRRVESRGRSTANADPRQLSSGARWRG